MSDKDSSVEAGEARVRLLVEADLPGLARILQWSIDEGWANFETRAVDLEELRGVWRSRSGRYPYLVAEAGGEVGAAAWASPWKPKAGYEWTAEVSVYVLPGHQGRGLARRLYERLFALLGAQGYRELIAGVALPNEPSVKLHEAFGMRLVGVFEGCGFKMGAWRDVGYWSKRLDGGDPPAPVRDVSEAASRLWCGDGEEPGGAGAVV